MGTCRLFEDVAAEVNSTKSDSTGTLELSGQITILVLASFEQIWAINIVSFVEGIALIVILDLLINKSFIGNLRIQSNISKLCSACRNIIFIICSLTKLCKA